EGDRYRLARPLESLAIPATLQDLLMAQLDQLSAVKELAQLAAALGREFTYDVLAELSPWDDVTLQGKLDRLVTEALLVQRGRPPHARYTFRHALIQETAYQSMLKSRRQRYH